MSPPRRLTPPSPATVAHLRELAERRLTPGELAAYVDAPMSDEEREGIVALIDWFTRRYPTPAERLAYARRKYREWSRSMPPRK